MNRTAAKTGNAGPGIRSDCEIVLETGNQVGITIDLISKVKTLYDESITALCKEVLGFYGVENAHLKINDSGALPFVIAARMEAAIKQIMDTDLDYLPEFLPENSYSTAPGRFRFARLYIPGNNPALMINAGLHSADGLILDLEDSVAPSRKDEARILVRNALRQIYFGGSERMVRINQGERGLKDLDSLIPHSVNLILIPKCEDPENVRNIDIKISEIKMRYGLTNPVFLMPIIESALGIENSYDIARASVNIAAIAIGLEDYTSDIGVLRTNEGRESLYARTRLINAAKAAGIQPIDSVFSDVADMEALKSSVYESRSLGFEGMGCIHPRQIAVVRQGYFPSQDELERSVKIVEAYEEALKNGMGVVALGSKMIDPPVVARAQKSVDLAIRLGLLPADRVSGEGSR
ncbi:MAG: citrate lyase acyl carrier protein [Bacteroidales bacterium]